MIVFIPIVLTCLVAEPSACLPIMGYAEATEAECMDSLSEAIAYSIARPDLYIAGLACVESHILDDPA
jgi:hypothetical protein